MSGIIEEVHWGDRLHLMNQGTHMFADRFTTIFDGININVSNVRTNRALLRVLFNGSKYSHCCLKIMIGITFMGVIVFYTAPHIGTLNNNVLLQMYPPAMLPWEWGMGDGAFGDSWHIMVKIPELLTENEVFFNTIFNYWRLRVEHIIGDVKNHDMLSGVFLGSYAILKASLDLTVHLTNMKLKAALPRYETCGPWGHRPGSALSQ
jgi:hypothetical protein